MFLKILATRIVTRQLLIGLTIWATVLGAGVPCRPVVADSLVPREHHAWGRFGEGSWRRVRVVSRTLDENGQVISETTTETTSTLIDVADSGYALKVNSSVAVVGKRFDDWVIKDTLFADPFLAQV